MATDISQVAAQAANILDQVMTVEPMIAGIAGVFVPGIGLVQPEVMALAPLVEKALRAVAAGNNADMAGAVIEVAKHLLPGMPNSPILSSPEPPAGSWTPMPAAINP